MMWTLDNDGDECLVDESKLRKMARNNGIIDWDTMQIDDLIDCIHECFPDVTIQAA